MSGQKCEYRLRVGNYRLLFKIAEDAILIYDIGLRGQIYK
jgi:mRNA-degrading endonuclease RelE of RelBE toxin-antitoxin system